MRQFRRRAKISPLLPYPRKKSCTNHPFLKNLGLMDIFARTLALSKRNHILQQRVNALRDETQSFISSVVKNPVNEEKQAEDFLSTDSQLVSSSSEISSTSPIPSSFESRSDSELNKVSSSSEVISKESTERYNRSCKKDKK